MDRFASMHDTDIDKLGIPNQRGAGGGEEGWKGRKRARELSELKGRLDRASEKEQQSWDLLKQAVEGKGSCVDQGRFKATGINKAAQKMQEQTVGLVSATEFRRAREEAESLEATEAKRREDEQAAEEEAREAVKRKAEKKKRKAADKKKRLQKSKMSFALEEDEEQGLDKDNVSQDNVNTSAPHPAELDGGQPPAVRGTDSEAGRLASGDGTRADISREVASSSAARSSGDEGGGGGKQGRSLKGAAADEDNSSAASMLRARLER